MSRQVLILKGLPASGKSSYAKELLDKQPNAYKRINRDDIRSMLDNAHYSKDNEKFVTQVRDMLIIQALNAGKHILIDDTNLSPKNEEHFRQLVHKYNKDNNDSVTLNVMFFDVPVEECIKRDLKRMASVGKDVIMRMYNEHLAPKIEPMQQDESLPKAILIDIDGTIADKCQRSPYAWDKVHEDLPKKHVIEVVGAMFRAGHQLIFMSGRDSVCRDLTIEWIKKHLADHIVVDGDKHSFQLHMRPQGDMRKDSIVKKELFDQHVRGKYYITIVLDDRSQVVELWRKELGLTCLQVDYGDF